MVNLLPLAQSEKIKAVIATKDYTDAEYLVFATKKGIVKKTHFLTTTRRSEADGIIAINLKDDDELVGGPSHQRAGRHSDPVSSKGQAIRFDERQARPMGRATAGVRGMRLRQGDEVIAVNIAEDDAELLVVTRNGFGKRTRLPEYPTKGRGGLGVKTVQLTEARGELVGARVVREGYQVMLISTGGTVIRIPVSDIRRMGRSTQGVIVMRLRGDERVSSLAPVVEADEEELPEAASEPPEEPASG